jgi:hypothetical protein
MSHPTMNNSPLRLFVIRREEILAMCARKLESIAEQRALLECQLTPACLGRDEEIIRQTIGVLAEVEEKTIFLRDHLGDFVERDASASETLDVRASLRPVKVDLRSLLFAKDPKLDLTTQLYNTIGRTP